MHRVFLLVHNTLATDPDEYTSCIRALEAAIKEASVDVWLIYSLGGAPSAAQRHETAAMWKRVGRCLPTAAVGAVTPLVKGIVTAIMWLTPGNDLKLFYPSEFDKGLAFLKVSEKKGLLLSAITEALGQIGGALLLGTKDRPPAA